MGGDVAGGQQAEADDGGAGGGVDDLIDPAGLEPSVEVHVAGIGDAATVFQASEPPLFTGNDLFRGVLVVLNGHHGIPRLEVVGRIGAVHAVGDVLVLDNGVGLEGHDDGAGDGLAVLLGLRSVDAKQARGVGYVVLPAAPDDGVALAHQEAVAGVQGRVRSDVGGAVDVAQGQGLAPVEDVEEQAAVALGRVVGAQDAEVGGELDESLLIAGRELDVGDGLVGRMHGVDGEVGDAIDLGVGANVAEGLAVGEGFL